MQREYEKHGFFSFSESRNRELCCLKYGESEINTVGRILEVSREEIRTRGGDKKVVLHGLIADDTAKRPFVSWEEREELARDTILRIKNASVKRWKDLSALYLGKNTKISVIKEVIDFPGYAELVKPKKRSIEEIVRCEGAFDVIVEGNIVAISGDSNKRTLVLDDGTGAVFLVLREEEKAKRIYFGMPVRARGNVVNAEKGYVLMAEEVKMSDDAFIITEMNNFLCRYT